MLLAIRLSRWLPPGLEVPGMTTIKCQVVRNMGPYRESLLSSPQQVAALLMLEKRLSLVHQAL